MLLLRLAWGQLGRSSADLRESVEEFSLCGLDESVGSLKEVGDFGDTVRKGVRFEKCQNTGKTPRKDKVDSTKTAEEMSNRRINIPRNKLGVTKNSTKTDIKSSPRRPSVKDSSRSHK